MPPTPARARFGPPNPPPAPNKPVLNDLTTGFVGRLRARDRQAWFELWDTFGPVLRSQLSRWGRGRIGRETVQDLSQETLAALSTAIDRHDPSKGARFSTWLFAIAKHTLGDELDRRGAIKRGSGVKPQSLEDFDRAGDQEAPDAAYEAAVFDAKVARALRDVEREVGFEHFQVFRMRILEGQTGKSVAEALGKSEPTVSRHLDGVRQSLREHLKDIFSRFSFVKEEWEELERNGLAPNPKKQSDAAFDEAVSEVFHRVNQRREGAPHA